MASSTEEHKEVRHPRECIKDYCLLHCEKKEMRNSRRSVSECTMKSCPLWYYRLGKLKWEKPDRDLSKVKQEKRIQKLRTARRKVENAEMALKRAQKDAEAKEQVYKKYLADVEAQKERLYEAKTFVSELENAFYNKEDPDGIWR